MPELRAPPRQQEQPGGRHGHLHSGRVALVSVCAAFKSARPSAVACCSSVVRTVQPGKWEGLVIFWPSSQPDSLCRAASSLAVRQPPPPASQAARQGASPRSDGKFDGNADKLVEKSCVDSEESRLFSIPVVNRLNLDIVLAVWLRGSICRAQPAAIALTCSRGPPTAAAPHITWNSSNASLDPSGTADR